MNKLLKIALAVALVMGGLFGLDKASAAICLVQNGCTGTGQIPAQGQVLIGNSGGTYTPGTIAGGSSTIITAGNQFLLVQQVGVNATLTPLSVLSLSSSSDISFSLATGTNITATYLNPHGFTSTTIQSVLNALSGTGLITYNSSTGVFNATNTGNWAGTWQGVNSTTFYLASNPSAYISNITGLVTQGTNVTITGSGTSASPYVINSTGGSTSVTSSQIAYGSGSNTLTSTSTFTINSSTGDVEPLSLGTNLYANQFPGADMCAKINNAIARLPAAGGTVYVPAGTYTCSAADVITGPSEYQNVQLIGAGGGGFYAAGATTLILGTANTTGTLITWNSNGFSSAGFGVFNMSLVGPAGIAGIGSSTIASSYGIQIGGTGGTSPGAFAFVMNGVQISGFGTGFYSGSNVSFLDMTNSVLQKNGQDYAGPSVSGANGENMRFSNDIIADCNSASGQGISAFCFDVQLSGNVQYTINNTSFDDAQVYSSQFGGTANIWNFTDDHFEDPNTGAACYDRILTQPSFAGAAATVFNIKGGDFMEDKTSGACGEFIAYGGTLVLNGVTGDINNNVSTPMADFATPLNNQATISWDGLTNQSYNTGSGLAFTDVYGTTPTSMDGLGFGSTTAAFSFTTSTSIFGNNLEYVGNSPNIQGMYTSTSQFAGAGVQLTGPTSLGAYGGTLLIQQNTSASGATDGGFSLNQVSATGTYENTYLSSDYASSTMTLGGSKDIILNNNLVDGSGNKYVTSTASGVSSFNTQTGATSYVVTCVSGCTATTSTTSTALTITSGGGSSTVAFLANGSIFLSTSTINFQQGTNVTITTSTNGTYTISASGGGVATATPYSAGYLTVVSSSLAITNSTIFQNATGTGIGTTIPRSYFDIDGNSGAFTGLVSLENNLAQGYTAIDFYDASGTKRAGVGVGNSSAGAPYTENLYIGTDVASTSVVFLNASAGIVETINASGTTFSSTSTFNSSTIINSTLTQLGGVVSLASTTVTGNTTTTNLTVTGVTSALGLFGANGALSQYAGTNPCGANQAINIFNSSGVGTCTNVNTPSTTIPTVFVTSFNGSSGAVTGVSSEQSSTGAGAISVSAATGTNIQHSVISPLNLSTINASTSQIANLTDASGNKYSTSTSAGGGGGGNVTVNPSSTVINGYFPFYTVNGSSTISPTSTIYQNSSTKDITLGSSSDNGLFSIVNASNTAVLKVSSTTNQTSSAVLLDLQATSSVFQVLASGHINATGTKPSMGTCGTSPSVVGNDAAGTITIGSGVVTACTLNFAIPYESSNIAVLESDNSTAVTGDVSAVTTSSVTFSFSATLGGGKLYYWVIENL